MESQPPKPLKDITTMLGVRSRPDAGWVARVIGCSRPAAETAIAEIAQRTEAVAEMSEKISGTGREYYAQFPAPIELYAMVRLTRPSTLIESGVASGVSTTFLLLGVSSNRKGLLHSIDLPTMRTGHRGDESWAIPAGLSSGWAIPRVLKKRWDLRLGRSEDVLPRLLPEVGRVDLYCHDSPISARHLAFELEAIAPYLRPGSLVVADNTSANRRAFESAARRAGTQPVYRHKSSLGAFRVAPVRPLGADSQKPLARPARGRA